MTNARMSRRTAVGALTAALCSASGSRAQPAPTQNASQHPAHAAALTHLRNRDWAALSAATVALAPQSASVLLGDLGDSTPFGVDLAGLEALPMGCTIAAAIEVEWAWRHRGSGVSSTVTEAGWRGFEAQLSAARAHVERAARADRNDGVAHAIGLRVARGLSDRDGLDRGLHSYLIAARRPVGGLSAYMVSITSKWLGSEEECLRFARAMWRLDPPASCGLLPHAHFECWQSRGLEGADELARYFGAAEVRAEIMAADDRFDAGPPDSDAYANLYAHGRFSFVFAIMDERERARRHFLAMGDRVAGPWADLPDPRAAVRIAREALGLGAT